jgi:methylthioribose-1-phosphate isomerase
MIETKSTIRAVAWHDGPRGPVVRLLDQRKLPLQTVWLDCERPDDVADAIRTLAVRGAPAIGIAAAYGLAQSMVQACSSELADGAFDALVAEVARRFAATRPTAVNLFWALERMVARAAMTRGQPVAERARDLVAEAIAIHDEDIASCLAMGAHGAPLMPRQGGVLTHCNTGGLATGGHGTALGVLRSALALGHELHVYVDETRPLLQGARLTAWECAQDGLPATLITDNMAAHLMKLGRVQAAIVGADRIAVQGDTANKIGTYGVAILCKYHGIPFYVAAPTSTVDLRCPDGDHIPIEERAPAEVTHLGGQRIAAEGTGVFNPAFDVVPAALIAGIITEEGVARAPFTPDLTAMVARAQERAKRVRAPGLPA